MKSQVKLLTSLLVDCGREMRYNSKRDITRVEQRTACEGESFLFITLPHLDDLLMAGLSDGLLPSHEGWSSKRGTVLPKFLSDLWGAVFAADGVLLSNPDPRAIYWIRQISRLFKKTRGLPSAKIMADAVEAFVETDRSLSQVRPPSYVDSLRDISHWVFGPVVGRLFSEELVFKHGPGAVSEKLDRHAKYGFKTVSQRAADWIGVEYFRPTWSTLLESPPEYGEVPARLIAVPKTHTKPRLISIEPSFNQYLQQGAHSVLKRELGKSKICGYESQIPNRRLAQLGSQTGKLATLDLSEASDRVHYGLVRMLFSWNQQFVKLLDATRSREVDLGDGRLLALNKFASMGSALTFPVETMVFTVAVLYALSMEEDGYVSRAKVLKNLKRDDVRVYGDDLIVPAAVSARLIRVLTDMGLKVNSSKSFTSGYFRESCGGDYYRGHDVSPVYSRRDLPSSVDQSAELVSAVDMHNQLFLKGQFGEATSYLEALVRSHVPDIPVLDMANPRYESFSGLFLLGHSDCFRSRWNSDLHLMEIWAPKLKHKRRAVNAEWRSLLMELLTRERHVEEADNLDFDGRPVSARIKHRWLRL